jgi:hypothetical protein
MSTPFDSQSNTPIETPHTPQVKTFAFSNYIMSFVKKNVFISSSFIMLMTVTTGQWCYIQ